MLVDPEQEEIGRHNFHEAMSADITRRDAIKAAIAGGSGLGAAYFGYSELNGDRVKTAFIGTGDEGLSLIHI